MDNWNINAVFDDDDDDDDDDSSTILGVCFCFLLLFSC